MSDESQPVTSTPGYGDLLDRISRTYDQGRGRAAQAVNI